MRGIPWRLLAAGVLTAVLLDLPFPLAGPLPPWRSVIAWFALVPLLTELLRLPVTASEMAEGPVEGRARIRGVANCLVWSFLGGWLAGALWFGLNCYWVHSTMRLYGGMGPGLAALSLVMFSLYLGFWFGVFGLALGMVHRAALSRASSSGGGGWIALAAIPFLWTAMEYALAQVPQFPWDLLGYSQVDNSLLMRLSPWTGVYGVSFVLATGNVLLVLFFLSMRLNIGRWAPALRPGTHRWVRHTERGNAARYAGFSGLLLAILCSCGLFLKPPQPAATATAMLVQPNLDVASDDVWVGPDWDRHMAQFAQLAGESCNGSFAGFPGNAFVDSKAGCDPAATRPALIVWPESPAPFRDADPKLQSAIAAIAQAHKSPMIVGDVGMDAAPDSQQYRIYNSASVVAADGHFAGRYDKIHLVPFGEYVPFRQLLFFVRQISTLTDMSTGTLRKTFRIASANGSGGNDIHRFGIFICYEAVFGDEVRQFAQMGAEALVNISDDGWYGDTSAPWQHLNMARMRAIENRRWILRDTNNGLTSSIDPYGTVRQSIPRHQVGVLPAQFGYNSELTYYTEHGDLLPALCAILALGMLVASVRSLVGQAYGRSPRGIPRPLQ